jgi:hypothetical protein
MRTVVMSVLLIGLFSPAALAEQARSGGAAGNPRIKACSLLTKELAMKVSGAANKLVFDLPPEEEAVGNGSACEYAGIRLQIDAVSMDAIERVVKEQKRGGGSSRSANWVPVSGVGDRAYFNADDRNFAELIGYVGGRTFTIQMDIPFQSTAEKVKPNAIALANAIIPKLK